jgi:hypothetical protein
MRDEKKPGDVLKAPGDALDDVAVIWGLRPAKPYENRSELGNNPRGAERRD